MTTRKVTIYLTTTGPSTSTLSANEWAASNIVASNDKTLQVMKDGETCDLTITNLGTQTASVKLGSNEQQSIAHQDSISETGFDPGDNGVSLQLYNSDLAAPYVTLTLTKKSPAV